MDMAVVMDGWAIAAAATITDGAEVGDTIMVGGIATEGLRKLKWEPLAWAAIWASTALRCSPARYAQRLLQI